MSQHDNHDHDTQNLSGTHNTNPQPVIAQPHVTDAKKAAAVPEQQHAGAGTPDHAVSSSKPSAGNPSATKVGTDTGGSHHQPQSESQPQPQSQSQHSPTTTAPTPAPTPAPSLGKLYIPPVNPYRTHEQERAEAEQMERELDEPLPEYGTKEYHEWHNEVEMKRLNRNK